MQHPPRKGNNLCKTDHFRTQKQSTNSNQEGRISEQGIMNPTKMQRSITSSAFLFDYFLSGYANEILSCKNYFRAPPKASPHCRHVFGYSRKSPHTTGTVSGVPENLPTSPARFRASPKVCRHRWHSFGASRRTKN